MLAARKKLEADLQMQAQRTEQVQAASPETLEVIVNSIADAFARCSPFSDAALLVAFKANPEEVAAHNDQVLQEGAERAHPKG